MDFVSQSFELKVRSHDFVLLNCRQVSNGSPEADVIGEMPKTVALGALDLESTQVTAYL